MLNTSGQSGHPCLSPDFSGKAFSFSPLRIILALSLSYIGFCDVKASCLCTHFGESFYHGWMLNFIKAFSAFVEMIKWFLSCLHMVYHILWFAYVEPSLWTWDESNLLMMYDSCMYCWVWFANILLRIFASIFIKDYWPVLFLSGWHLCLVWVSGWWWLHRVSLRVFLPL